jgi:hypothetical protein
MPALPEGFTVVLAGQTPSLAPNLFLPAVTVEMSDCGGGGASETPWMAVKGAAESCASLSGGVGDIGAGGRCAGKKSGGREVTVWRREFFSEVAADF